MIPVDPMIKTWLADHPYDPNDPSTLPKGWEIRFGIRGRFLKYDDVQHAEARNMIVLRETNVSVPCGYANREWEALKANLQEGDEIWRVGDHGGEAIYLIRNNEIVMDRTSKYPFPKRGFHLFLTCC